MEPFVRHFTGQHFLDTLSIVEDGSAKPKIEGKVFQKTFLPNYAIH